MRKVKSRVSSILPNSLSKWFSPARTGLSNNGSNNNGISRKRELSESGSENENDSTDGDEIGIRQSSLTNEVNQLPPLKRIRKNDVSTKFLCLLFL